MFGKALTVSDMVITASINDGVNIEMRQVAQVVVTCVMDGSEVSKVFADEGIEFISEGGLLGVEYKRGADITEICDRKALAKQIRANEQENEEMQLHNKGE